MIARLWSAHAAQAQAPAYRDHLTAHVLPTLRTLAGYSGTMLLEREEADGVELIVITVWQSLDAVRQFAGDEIGRAVVADDASVLLDRFDRHVRHFTLVVNDRM